MFAAGNLVHPAETADVAALTGRHAAAQLARLLAADADPAGGAATIPVTVTDPLLWISPAAIRVPGPQPPRGRFVLRSAVHAPVAHLEVRQDGRLLHRTRTRLLPGRSVQLSGSWVGDVARDGGPVSVTAASGRAS